MHERRATSANVSVSPSMAFSLSPAVEPSIDVSAQSRVGTVVGGKWRLDRVIGVGGMATVYAATHRNRARVAIKLVHAHLGTAALERFSKETYLGNLVDHPGIVRVLDEGTTDDGVPFLVMDLLEGETLHERLVRTGPLPVGLAVDIACALLDVLAATHAAKLVHRDVKPENLFLLASGGIRLLDFGIARERIFGEQGETISGVVMGSPAFMAPEQALGRKDAIDARTDLWAVAATLFVALTDRDLRDGKSPQERFCAALLPCAPVASLAPALPHALAAVLDRALAYEPEARFSSAYEMGDALRAAANASPGASVPPPSGSVARRSQSDTLIMTPPGPPRGGGPAPRSSRAASAFPSSVGGAAPASSRAVKTPSSVRAQIVDDDVSPVLGLPRPWPWTLIAAGTATAALVTGIVILAGPDEPAKPARASPALVPNVASAPRPTALDAERPRSEVNESPTPATNTSVKPIETPPSRKLPHAPASKRPEVVAPAPPPLAAPARSVDPLASGRF